MFEGSKLSLRAWSMAIYLMMSTKKTVASTTLAQQLDATQKTAWFLELRIRQTFKQPKNQKDKLTGEVELDECFVGSKNKNRHWNKKVPKSKGRCHIDKVPVTGMLERDGRVCKVAETTGKKHLTAPILRNVDRKATLYMDDWRGYRTIQKVYKHAIVDHGHNIYAVGSAYTNTIEQFWGNFCKRPIIGIYNHVERKHLQRYFYEFAFRFNTHNVTISERFSMPILGCQKRITWNQLTK